MDAEPSTDPTEGPAAPGVVDLFLLFGRIGLTSFGGGLSAWLMRELVHRRGWVSEEEFLNAIGLSQALPGINVANLAIWFGYRLRGIPGALVSLGGLVLLPAIVIILIASIFAALSDYPVVNLALDGAAAATIGLSATMGITMAAKLPRRTVPLLIAAIAFIMVGFLHWPLIWVVLGVGLVSVAVEYVRLGRPDAP